MGTGRNGSQHSPKHTRRQKGRPHAGQGRHVDSGTGSGVFSGGGSGRAIAGNTPLRAAWCSDPLISATHKWDTARSNKESSHAARSTSQNQKITMTHLGQKRIEPKPDRRTRSISTRIRVRLSQKFGHIGTRHKKPGQDCVGH